LELFIFSVGGNSSNSISSSSSSNSSSSSSNSNNNNNTISIIIFIVETTHSCQLQIFGGINLNNERNLFGLCPDIMNNYRSIQKHFCLSLQDNPSVVQR